MEVEYGTPCWREGYRAAISAEDAHAEITKIGMARGREVVAADLVKAAKSKKNPLHPAFEWNDTKAGKEHRLAQGRAMLRSLVVTRLESPDYPTRVLQVKRLSAEDGSHTSRKVYARTEDMLADVEGRKQLVARALAEAESYVKRWHYLEELATMIASIKRTLKKYGPSPVKSSPRGLGHTRKAGPKKPD